MSGWRIIYTLPCRCELQQLYDPTSERHGSVLLAPRGRCRDHLCRICGDAPFEDAELCHDCLLKAQAQL